MARSFLTPVDMNQLEVRNQRIHNLASAPGSPVGGQVYYDTVLLASYVWNGSAWVSADASKLVGTIPNTALTTNPLARSNHTGTQLASTISDFAATAQGYHLNQFAVPTANIPMAGFKLTGLNTAPTTAGDSAEYSWVIAQVQAAAAGIASKVPARLITTTNNALSGLAAIDGVTPIAGDRVLVTGQTTTTANGIYNAASGAWARTTIDGAAPGELEGGATWLITEGTVWAGSQWRQATTGVITVGTTAISIVQFSASTPYSAGNGITFTGAVISVNANTGISVTGSGVAVDFTVVPKKFSATIGDGSTTSIVVTHNLGTQDVVMIARQTLTPFTVVECDMSATTTNTSTFAFAVAPATNAYRVTVIG